MSKEEEARLIYSLNVWIKNCQTFYNSFKDIFYIRSDAVKQLEYRCDQVTTIAEFLFSGKFISSNKYLEAVDKVKILKEQARKK